MRLDVLPPSAILPAAMAPPICLLLAAAPLATTLRPGAIAVQSCIQSWTSAPGSRQPPRPTCPPAHLPAFDAIIKQLHAINPNMVFSLELFNRDYWQQDPLEVAKLGLEKMKTIVAENIG